MGTSAMLYIIDRGETRIAALTSTDAYPDGMGADLLQFISNRKNLRMLREALPRCLPLDQASKDRLIGCRTAESNRYIESHPEYLYMQGVHMLRDLISSEGEVRVWNRFDDRRYDDWAYVIDFDRNTFEVYKGMSGVPVPEGERFHDPAGADAKGIHPFKEVAVFDMDDLPSSPEFVSVCSERERPMLEEE